MPNCPDCSTEHVVKNGHIHNGKQRFKCSHCGRQFIENPTNIARVTQVSQKWLQDYINQKYAQIPKQVKVTEKKRKINDTSR